MRCRGEGCKTTRKNKLKNAKCWREWGLCGRCAVKYHADQYKKNVVQSYKESHKYKELDKPGMNGFQGFKEELKIGTV